MTQKRTHVLNELIIRLGLSTTGLRLVQDSWSIGESDIWRGVGNRTIPPRHTPRCIVRYSDSIVERLPRKPYKKTMPVIVEVWEKFKKDAGDTIIVMGEKILERVIDAIEIDERMKTTGFPDNLVEEYNLVGEIIAENGSDLYVAVGYEFIYREAFKGTRKHN